MNELPLTYADVVALVETTTTHTRPVSVSELNRAVNFGYRKVLRAIRAVKPAPLETYVDPFTFTPGVNEYDVSSLFPPLVRPIRLTSMVNGRAVATFVYRSLQHDDALEAESRGPDAGAILLYDILEGLLPNGTTTTVGGSTTTIINVTSSAAFTAGGILSIVGFGPVQTSGSVSIPTDYLGRIVSIAGPSISIAPQLPVAPPGAGVVVRALRQKVLRLAAPPAASLSGRLWYQYSQGRLRANTDLLEPTASEHVDCIVAYALAQLKLSVGDADSDRWLRDADSMRAEMIQDLEPASYDNTEPMGSALHGVVRY